MMNTPKVPFVPAVAVPVLLPGVRLPPEPDWLALVKMKLTFVMLPLASTS